MSKKPTRNLAFDLGRVTESAALAAARWLGKGEKEAGDGAAVDAMRISFNALDIDGRVVIGEGEKDKAPMLFNGEEVGTKNGPQVDIAVDPVEGTNLLALGRPNSIAVCSMAPRGAMFNPGPAFYAKKIVVGPAAKGVVDIDAPVKDNLEKIAKAMGKKVNEITVFVLEKSRHENLIKEIRGSGARISLQTDGDVAGALDAVMPETDIDVLMGTGGTPEGILAATGIKIIGGDILMKLDPQSDEERNAIINEGYDLKEVYGTDQLITSDDTFFAATGISTGFLNGVRYSKDGAYTHTIVMRGLTGTVRYIEAHHILNKLKKISAVDYS
jgi:fructose-1,6-bisphosphatase II